MSRCSSGAVLRPGRPRQPSRAGPATGTTTSSTSRMASPGRRRAAPKAMARSPAARSTSALLCVVTSRTSTAAEHGPQRLQARDQPEGGEGEVGDDGQWRRRPSTRTASTAASMVEKPRRSASWSAAPASVSTTPRQTRRNNATPSSRSRPGHVVADRRLGQAEVAGGRAEAGVPRRRIEHRQLVEQGVAWARLGMNPAHASMNSDRSLRRGPAVLTIRRRASGSQA